MSNRSIFGTRGLRAVTAATVLVAGIGLVVPAVASAQQWAGSEGADTGSDFVDGLPGSVEGIPGSVGNVLGNTGSATEIVDGLLDEDPKQIVNGIATGIASLDTNGSLAPTQTCNATTVAGGPGITNTKHDLGRSGPTSFTLRHETYDVPDRIEVFYQGARIHDTGYIGDNSNEGTGSVVVNVPAGGETSVLVRVTGPGGTEWDYTVGCPNG